MRNKNIKLPQILTAAAIMTMVSAIPAFAASGWSMENGNWVYLDRNGDRVTDAWKKNDRGTHWFYLDEDGYMAVNQLIEYNDDYYYVNEDGAMVKNEWRKLEDKDDDEAYTDGTCWYYLGSNGKAVKNTSGKVKLTTINGKKYTFSDSAKMLYGWISEDGTMITDESDWSSGLYYCGEEDDGAAMYNSWKLLEVDDPDADDRADGNYWFFFGTNGKKVTSSNKTINNRKYTFDDRGVAQFEWTLASSSNASSSDALADNYKYYNNPERCWLASGWFYTVPEENVDAEAYHNDDEYWFYADKNGNLTKSRIRSINGYKYGFNEKGEMLEGLYALTFDENKKIETYREIEDIEEMPEEGDSESVYYFGNTPKDGVMAAKKNVDIVLEEKYTFGFRSNGEGIHGISDHSIYIKGRKMKADSDRKLQAVTFDGKEYLVNTSGVIQKKKTNVKDADETYYCTDASGVITYSGSEKK